MGSDLVARSLLMVLLFVAGLVGFWLLHRHGLAVPSVGGSPAPASTVPVLAVPS